MTGTAVRRMPDVVATGDRPGGAGRDQPHPPPPDDAVVARPGRGRGPAGLRPVHRTDVERARARRRPAGLGAALGARGDRRGRRRLRRRGAAAPDPVGVPGRALSPAAAGGARSPPWSSSRSARWCWRRSPSGRCSGGCSRGSCLRSGVLPTTSVLFGLWHVLPALHVGSANRGVSGAIGGSPWVVVTATVAFTALGGLVFGELRRRSGSVLAAHGRPLGDQRARRALRTPGLAAGRLIRHPWWMRTPVRGSARVEGAPERAPSAAGST